MKSIPFLLLFTTFNLAISQVKPPEAFISIGVFYEEQLEPNSYFGLAVGSELFAYKFIAPEIDINYYFGGESKENWNVDQSTGDINFRVNLNNLFESWVWSVGPKLFLKDDINQFVFIPKYHFGNQKAKGSYFDSNELDIDQESKTKFNFWSFSLGYEFVGKERVGKTGIYLTYTGFDAGKSLNKLDFSEQVYRRNNYNTKAVGITVRLSSGFGKRKS